MNADWQDGVYALSDLVAPSRWQGLQDHFAEVLGIGLRTISPDKTLLVNPSWPTGLDTDRLTEAFKLGEELDELFPPGRMPQDLTTISRPLGISFTALPLRATADRIVAYIIIGPVVLGKREDAEEFRERASRLGLDPKALWPLWMTIKLSSFSSMRLVLRLLEDVGNTLLEMAYQARALSAIIPEVPHVDQALLDYYRERLFQSLLDAATAATKAEGGSVMVYDAKQKALRIAAAHGLSEDVVADTRLQPGEGIAGLAASRREALLIDEHTVDGDVKRRMTRSELVSSLVAPLVPDLAQEPIGVVNLRTSNPQQRFTHEHLQLLRQLMNLAGVALGGFQLSAGQAPPPSTSPSP